MCFEFEVARLAGGTMCYEPGPVFVVRMMPGDSWQLRSVRAWVVFAVKLEGRT